MSDIQQLSIFGEDEKPHDCCYCCEHFAEFKEPRTYTNRDGEFGIFGMCCKTYCKNGSYALYTVYVPGGKCKEFKKAKRRNQNASNP